MRIVVRGQQEPSTNSEAQVLVSPYLDYFRGTATKAQSPTRNLMTASPSYLHTARKEFMRLRQNQLYTIPQLIESSLCSPTKTLMRRSWLQQISPVCKATVNGCVCHSGTSTDLLSCCDYQSTVVYGAFLLL